MHRPTRGYIDAQTAKCLLDARVFAGNGARVPKGSTSAAILRRRLRGHNFSVVAASGATLIFAVVGWTVLYFAAYWVTMFTLTVAKAGGAQLPARFDFVCVTVFAILMTIAAVDAWLFPGEHVVDERPAYKTAGDLLLFLPRLTVTVPLNFMAWAYLPARAYPDAAALLERLRDRRKLPLTELPFDLPDEQNRSRILRVLHILHFVEVRPERDQLWLRLSPLAPAGLRASDADDADDEFARMRRATVLEKKNALPSPKRQLPGHDRHHL